jgi:hypothetical protein
VALMAMLDLPALHAAQLNREPFEYLILPGFIRAESLPELHRDYPQISAPGSFPVGQLAAGPAFAALVDEIRGANFREVCAEKFRLDLRRRPMTLTARGQCGARDGRIHTDSKSKLITVLLYMNSRWEESGGRLRLLRNADDINAVIAEVPPVEGTLVLFRRSDNSWHGHLPFVGPRRVVQFNWLSSRLRARFETFRHGVSGWVKRLGSFMGRSSPASAYRG